MDVIDHKELAISRLATQFKESTNLINYIRSLLVEANTLESIFKSLIEDRWIDTAEGIQLDILGSIVGQPRVIIGAELFGYFGFAVNLESGPFGSIKDPSLGDRFRANKEPTVGNRELSDEEYRLWIRARIAKNITTSTPEEVISQVKFVTKAQQIILSDGDTQYSIAIGKLLTNDEKAILLNTQIVPKTAGVRVNYQSQYDYKNFFGFQGVPNSAGLGSLSNANQGGKLGKLIV